MKQTLLVVSLSLLAFLPGCNRPPGAVQRQSREGRAPEQSGEPTRPSALEPRKEAKAEVSFDTARDGEFAQFVTRTAGDMVKKVAVGIERRGTMRVEVGESVSPDDVLPFTKGLLAGARKEFPGKPFSLTVYDPHDEPILKAHYQPDQGVRYEVARSNSGDPKATQGERAAPGSASAAEDLPSQGTTEKDRRFAGWAMKTAPDYLRYVQADLERRRRLWFGVTRTVQPDDVPKLTKSLLEGARREFPGGELTAAVFDPEGERIGKAMLAADGKIHWSR
jgi:hypothetical protein